MKATIGMTNSNEITWSEFMLTFTTLVRDKKNSPAVRRLDTRVDNILSQEVERNRIPTVRALSSMSPEDLLRIKGLGRMCVLYIQKTMKVLGMPLAPTESDARVMCALS